MFYEPAKRLSPQMQLAPLIDMVFLLLIFFMVATIFPDDSGITVEKPRASSSAPLPREHLLFSIARGGDIHFDGRMVTPAEATEIIRRGTMDKPETSVIIDADRNSVTGHLVKFLDLAREAGAKNIAIGTEPEENPAPAGRD